MSAIRSALDEMASVDSADLSLDQLDADIIELIKVGQRVEVLLTSRLGALASRHGDAMLGYTSPTAYLIHRGRMTAGRAHRAVADWNAADKAPGAASAWKDGRLSTDQARLMFRLAEAVPDAYPAAEEALTEIVEPLTVRETAIALEYWRQSVDGPGDLDTEPQMTRRGVSLSGSIHGMRRLDGWLTDLAGEALEIALTALMPAPLDDDERTPRQRRHDALDDLARGYLDSGNAPLAGGEKPHLVILTDLGALQGVAGGTHETLDGSVITIDRLRRIACDASVSRIVLGPESEVLDVGRKTRVWPAAVRKAIVARDRQCTAAGCDRRPRWCDIHHVDHWADLGITGVENGRLLCRFHHTLEHAREASLQARERRRAEG